VHYQYKGGRTFCPEERGWSPPNKKSGEENKSRRAYEDTGEDKNGERGLIAG